MSERPTKWGYSQDQERYELVDGGREEAIEMGRDYGEGGVFWVARLVANDWLPSLLGAIETDWLIDTAQDHFYDNAGGDPDGGTTLDATPEQLNELVAKLHAVAEAWLIEHGLRWADWYEVVSETEEEVSRD